MQVAHWVAIGMFCTSLATQIGGLQHGWHDAVTPTFVSGLVMNIGSIAIALGTGKIQMGGNGNAPKP